MNTKKLKNFVASTLIVLAMGVATWATLIYIFREELTQLWRLI